MKFGKEFTSHLEETIPEWRDKFLCYKLLKKLLKRLPPNLDVHQQSLRDEPCGLPHHAEHLQDWFVRILNEELEKLNDFYVDKEEEFIILFQELKDRIERVKEKSSNDALFTSDDEFSEETMDIREDFVTIHGKMILLKNYSSLNFAGLMKILKKYDKRTGGLLRIPFTQLVLRQPFFTTEPLTRLVNECEANLELLFPLEAEVIESSTSQGNPCITPQSRTTDTTAQPSAALSEETLDIQRSTLAAMKAIRGLQKASSTSNPLSFSALMRNLDDEGNGAVTAENSPANSPADFENDEKSDEENTHTE